jgi:site-specific DNA-methyltransferase (adenine-specific)/site-specific DNA-methyltransferase (cytosine-N4-specific)
MPNFAVKTNIFYKGLCESILKQTSKFPDKAVNLIVTSPPYSDRRKNSYGGVSSDKYVDWILPITNQLFRVLKDDGSLIINIKEHVQNGERQTYVLEMILEMKKQGWRWVEEYCWYKKTAFPGKWSNRFRDSFERCLHFTKAKSFYMDQDSVKVPVGDWAEKRFKSMTENDFIRYTSSNNSHLGRNVSNWLGRQLVYPHNVLVFEAEHYSPSLNVLEISPVTGQTNHSACFPVELPTWFIALLSRKGDIVLDPFAGVGTTAKASILLERNYIGIEKDAEYLTIARKEVSQLLKLVDASHADCEV